MCGGVRPDNEERLCDLNPVAEFGSADGAEGRDFDRVRGFGAEGHPVRVDRDRCDGRHRRRFLDWQQERWPWKSLRGVPAALVPADGDDGEECAHGENTDRDRLAAEPCDRFGDDARLRDKPPKQEGEPDGADEDAKGGG